MNGAYLANILAKTTWGLLLYGVAGFIMIILFIISCFQEN
jgi:hypothetical protein